jgi:hypothetical protein
MRWVVLSLLLSASAPSDLDVAKDVVAHPYVRGEVQSIDAFRNRDGRAGLTFRVHGTIHGRQGDRVDEAIVYVDQASRVLSMRGAPLDVREIRVGDRLDALDRGGMKPMIWPEPIGATIVVDEDR